ncbi:MAG TPA: TolC family protein [Vicinamibacteria bacterium]|nr:TolC family protein [Vicinamibacteria bacterium]
MSRRVAALVLAAATLAFRSPATAQEPLPQQPAPSPPAPAAPRPPVLERLTFDEAVERATSRNPTVAQAAQAILRAEALLSQARSVFYPLAYGNIATTVIDAPRGFAGNIVQPRVQTAFTATASYEVLAASGWAAKNQAADQAAIARVSAEETRRNVAISAAQAYLAVIAAERQVEIAVRNRDTARALEEYARTRLQAGQGSRLNHVRSVQQQASAESLRQIAELAVSRAEEALGVIVFANGPVGANGEPVFPPTPPPADDSWLDARPDVRLVRAELRAADRVVSDAWKNWLPTVTASFTPSYVTPPSLFEPAKTWTAFFSLKVPIFDATLRPDKRVREADRASARLRLDALTLEARSEVRIAREAVRSNEGIVASTREAAENAGEALRITEVAYRAGATTNIEVVQAQQDARNGEITAAVAEDRLRQARLDLLLALGRFP